MKWLSNSELVGAGQHVRRLPEHRQQWGGARPPPLRGQPILPGRGCVRGQPAHCGWCLQSTIAADRDLALPPRHPVFRSPPGWMTTSRAAALLRASSGGCRCLTTVWTRHRIADDTHNVRCLLRAHSLWCYCQTPGQRACLRPRLTFGVARYTRPLHPRGQHRQERSQADAVGARDLGQTRV